MTDPTEAFNAALAGNDVRLGAALDTMLIDELHEVARAARHLMSEAMRIARQRQRQQRERPDDGEPVPTEAVDLMAALRASIERARAERGNR